jgi:hypothetical protein
MRSAMGATRNTSNRWLRRSSRRLRTCTVAARPCSPARAWTGVMRIGSKSRTSTSARSPCAATALSRSGVTGPFASLRAEPCRTSRRPWRTSYRTRRPSRAASGSRSSGIIALWRPWTRRSRRCMTWWHTYAVNALRNGLSATVVAHQLGHRDANLIWTRYGRFVPNATDYQKAIEADSATDPATYQQSAQGA